VADQNVHSTELFDYLVHHTLAKLRIADIALELETAAAGGLHGATRFVGIVVVGAIDYGYVCALAGVEYGDGPTNARITASDDCYLALELAGGSVFGGLVARTRAKLLFRACSFEMLLGKWRFGLPV